MSQLSFRLTPENEQRLLAYVRQQGVSKGKAINAALALHPEMAKIQLEEQVGFRDTLKTGETFFMIRNHNE